MRILIILLTIFIASSGLSQAQHIDTERVFGGYRFTQDGKQLKMRDLVSTMQDHQQASVFIKKAQRQNSFANVFGGVGGALTGFIIGEAVFTGNDVNWTLAGIGLGIGLIGLPISISANNNTKKAVELYNQSFNFSSSKQNKTGIRIVVNGAGAGLSINF